MAALLQKKLFQALVSQTQKVKLCSPLSRCMSSDESEKKGWLKNILRVRTIEPSTSSHSSQLSDKEKVFDIQVHLLKPECMEEYLNQFSMFQKLMQEKETGARLAGSWTVMVGDQDEAVHIWEYSGGYPVLNKATEIYRKDKDFIEFRKNRNKMLRSRKNQIALRFSFWPPCDNVDPTHIYEMRSYTLKPGTMIEWGNNWARGLPSRLDNEIAVGGYFTQMGGDLYNVHHIWGYESMQQRKEAREAAWAKPGWDECVAYTVPLIRSLQTRILIPTPFSPLQ